MKTKKSLLSLLAVVLVLFVSATEKPKMNVQSLNSDHILLTVESPKAIFMETSIYDESGDVVYFKKSRKPISSVNKVFNVEHLANGNYKINLELNGLIVERDFAITSDKIFIGKEKELHAPFFVYNGKDLMITQLNFDKENYKVEIYDVNGLVYKKTLGNQSPLHTGFNLSELESGNFTVFLNSAENNFSYQFKK